MRPSGAFRHKGPITVLLNSHVDIIPLIRAHAAPHERFRFVVISPRTRRDFRSFLHSTDRVIPDASRAHSDYAGMLLAVAQRYRAALVFPGRRIDTLAANEERFRASGIPLLLPAASDSLAVLEDKSRFLAALTDLPEWVTPFRVVASATDWDAAVTSLQSAGTLCYKPTRSIFGMGFRVVGPAMVPRGLRHRVISADRARTFFDTHPGRPYVLMPYLPGAERSVDCLVRRGQLICAVVRRKHHDDSQVIERHRAIEAVSAQICHRFSLNGLVNIQFKEDADGQARLLEVNCRMSGGIVKSAASGLALPLWAIRLMLEMARPDDVPRPRIGARVDADHSRSPV